MDQELNDRHYPYLPLRLQVRQFVFEAEAFLDTGFEGGIAVPAAMLEGIGEADEEAQWRPIGGRPIYAPVYNGSFSVGNLGPFPVKVTALGDEILIGQQAIAHLTITLDHGQRVVVSP